MFTRTLPAITRMDLNGLHNDGSTNTDIRLRLESLRCKRLSAKTGFVLRELKGVVIDAVIERMEKTNEDILRAVTSLSACHSDYSYMAGRIIAAEIMKNVAESYVEAVQCYQTRVSRSRNIRMDGNFKLQRGGLSDEVVDFVLKNEKWIGETIDHVRDLSHDIMGMNTLSRTVLLKVEGELFERPQFAFMRVAISMTKKAEENKNKVKESYLALSSGRISVSSPTLFNAGTSKFNTASCYLVDQDDNMDSIAITPSRLMCLTAKNGGIGLNLSSLRATGSKIGNGAVSSGLPFKLDLVDVVGRAVEQGESKRPGAIATYLACWHADMMNWLRSRDAFAGAGKDKRFNTYFGVTLNDIFYKRVMLKKEWSFFSPHDCPLLLKTTGEAFEREYKKYEKAGKALHTMSAQALLTEIVNQQISTGMPYTVNIDVVNARSPHAHLGVIHNANLCAEIVQYADANEIAVCNLSTICVPAFVNDKGRIDYAGIAHAAGMAVEHLNALIDKAEYSLENPVFLRKADTRRYTRKRVTLLGADYDGEHNILSYSNFMHRPIGIGIQGFHDVLQMQGMAYDSDEARKTGALMYEAVYFGALRKSVEMAKYEGPFPSYDDQTPAQRRKLQFDMIKDFDRDKHLSHTRFEWKKLLRDFEMYGTRNSTLTCQPPTATSSQIYGNSESVECVASNRYSRSLNTGVYVVTNEHLVADLSKEKLWTREMVEALEENEGSVQKISTVPDGLKEIYRTAREIRPDAVTDMVAGMQPFIDQSVSLNRWLPQEGKDSLATVQCATLLYAWMKELKTGSYYTRNRPAVKPHTFGKIDHPVKAFAVTEECQKCCST